MFSRLRGYWQSVVVYAGVGGVAALVEWSVFYLTIAAFGAPYLVAAVAGFIIATWVNWFFSRKVAFLPSPGGSPHDLLKIYMASSFALAVNLAVMTALIESGVAGLLPAKIAGTGVGFFFNYALRQFVIYSRTPITFSQGAKRAKGLLKDQPKPATSDRD